MPVNSKCLRIPDLTEVPANAGLLMSLAWGSWVLSDNLWVGPGLCPEGAGATREVTRSLP